MAQIELLKTVASDGRYDFNGYILSIKIWKLDLSIQIGKRR